MATIPPTKQWRSGGEHFMSQAIKNMGDAADQITNEGVDLWKWFRDWKPAKDEGYMWSSHPNIQLLAGHVLVKESGHSGASCAICMRQLRIIATNGFEQWEAEM
jgi:hypothetical protein